MARKTLKEYETQRLKRNEKQREYRRKNRQLVDVWEQRARANFLIAHGWKVEPPADFPTLEQARDRQLVLRALYNEPIPDVDIDEVLQNIDPSDLPL